MTEQLHPMVPPNILLNNWGSDWFNERENFDVLLTQAYQAGADAELEECCKWFHQQGYHISVYEDLRTDRRPKPPSLKEQALKAAHIEVDSQGKNGSLIIRALEALPDD
jgi:predicted alpha/beta-hydrolase family hydrolase